MEKLSASPVHPRVCPYCQNESSVIKLEHNSKDHYPYQGLPYKPGWRCDKCGGVILKSYSGTLFWGRKYEGGNLAYRFMLTLRGREVSYLDHRNLCQKEICREREKLFYDIVEGLLSREQCPEDRDRWSIHLSFPSDRAFIQYSGNLSKGEDIMKAVMEVLDIDIR